jgi:hypothetical protein
LIKKRREADALRCVRRCQRGEYVFAPHAEIDRFLWLWHAREPFDDAQLTALSNAMRAEQLGAANAVDSDAVLAPADAGTRARRLRFVAPQHRLSPHCVQAGHTDAVVVPPPSPMPGRLAVCSASRRRRRQPQEPGPQPSRLVNVTELAAAGKQADLETERLRLTALSAKSVVELAREKTPPPPPPLKQ